MILIILLITLSMPFIPWHFMYLQFAKAKFPKLTISRCILINFNDYQISLLLLDVKIFQNFIQCLLELCNLQKKVLTRTVFGGARTGFPGDQTGYCGVHGRMAAPSSKVGPKAQVGIPIRNPAGNSKTKVLGTTLQDKGEDS